MKTTILITGATGNTGLPLVKQLATAGVPVRAMIHTPEKRSMVEGSTTEVAAGDFKNRASLEQAMKGIESAYLVSPPSLDQVRDQTAFVDTAKAMGVKHIVKLSALSTAPDSPVGLLRWHAEIEDHIRRSGLKYTFLYPTGPEAVTYTDIAWTLAGVIGKPVRYVSVSFDAALKGMVQAGYPDWLAADLVRLMQIWSEGKGSMVSVYVERLTGHKPLSVREFFDRHKSLFLAAA